MHESPTLPRPLVLGSTSRYRRELLSRLNLPFDVAAPEVDETPHDREPPKELALRLALAKARAVAALRPTAVVIGSDQVADLAGRPLGKPGNHEKAAKPSSFKRQLLSFARKRVLNRWIWRRWR